MREAVIVSAHTLEKSLYLQSVSTDTTSGLFAPTASWLVHQSEASIPQLTLTSIGGQDDKGVAERRVYNDGSKVQYQDGCTAGDEGGQAAGGMSEVHRG